MHIAAGFTAVVSGALAAAAPKRHGRHTLAGHVYYWAMVTMFATVTALTAMRPARDFYLLLFGGLALAAVTAGRHARRHPRSRLWRRWRAWHHMLWA